jgi:hypothetical protein
MRRSGVRGLFVLTCVRAGARRTRVRQAGGRKRLRGRHTARVAPRNAAEKPMHPRPFTPHSAQAWGQLSHADDNSASLAPDEFSHASGALQASPTPTDCPLSLNHSQPTRTSPAAVAAAA